LFFRFQNLRPGERLARKFSVVCVYITFAFGFLGLLSRMTGEHAMRGLDNPMLQMKPNTAIGFMCMSAALWLLLGRKGSWNYKLAYALAWAVTLLGGLTLSEWVTGWNFGIDNILFPESESIEHPGRMVAVSAVNFTLKGLALLMIDWETRRGVRPAQILSLLTAVVPFQVFIAYSYGAEAMLTVGNLPHLTQMSPHTAAAWLAISLATICARPGAGVVKPVFADVPSAGALRKVLLIAVVAPLLLAVVANRAQAVAFYHPGFGASLLTLFCVIFMMWALWRATAQVVHTEVDLINARDSAQDANKTKSEFLANMSHEIRTPLSAILGFTDLLRRKDLTEKQREDYSEVIARNGRQLSTLINDILDLSKVEAGKLTVESIPISLCKAVRDTIELIRPQADAKNLRIFFESSLGGHTDWIFSDPTRLNQIFLNLLGNAVKFTQAGEIRIQVARLADSDHDYSAFHVRIIDTGVGIEPDQHGSLFKAFSQADASTTRKFGGTGLGLILSKRLAKALGGDLQLEQSRPGHGSVFTLTLRAAAVQSMIKPSMDNLKPRALDNSQPLQGSSVLLAEDSTDNRSFLKMYLEKAGAAVDEAENGSQAFEMASRKDYGIVIMDIHMPLMDGYEATRRLRQVGIKTPIVALTAHASKSSLKRAIAEGCNDHLTKPVSMDTLIDTVKRHLSGA